MNERLIYIKFFKNSEELDDFFDVFPVDIRIYDQVMKRNTTYVYLNSELFKQYETFFGFYDKKYNGYIIPYSKPDVSLPYFFLSEEKSLCKDMVVFSAKYYSNIYCYLRKQKLKRILI